MSDTPRTDEQAFPGEWEDSVVGADFARELERENNELRELVDLITIQEESDSGRMGEITEKYRSRPHIKQEEY